MAEPKTTDEIPSLCQETFLPWKRFMILVYVAAGIFIGACSTAVTYAITTTAAVAVLKEQALDSKQRLDYLDKEVNRKLDILINRK